MRKLYIIGAIAIFATASPALADQFFGLTPSGATEVYFPLSLVATSDILANACIDVGWTTISSSETMVVCEMPVSVGQSILSALAGPRYATPPRHFIRFNLASQQNYARVQVSAWQEIQTAFGQTQRIELGNQNYHNNVTFYMINLGALYPPGTKFPNHASINVDYEFSKEHGGGLLIKKVHPGGAFDRAGLLENDIVTRIAKQRIADNDDLSDGLHKAIKNDTFEVEFYRGGERKSAAVPRIFREDAGPLPPRDLAEQPSTSAATVVVQQEFSVADELQKLADLMAKGLITQSEFDAQKARLLQR